MAAPSNTIWGPITNGSSSGRKGRIGLYYTTSDSNTQRSVTVQVWFWTIYSCSDGYEDYLYLNAGAGVSSASTLVATNIDIEHTVASGDGWNTANQTHLFTKTFTFNRSTSAQTINIYASFSGIDMLNGPCYVNTSLSVPALTSYTVSYNANGGSGAPGSQTKWYGSNITLSSSTPSRAGHTFKGWATSSGGGVAYAAGATYSANASVTLYAVWQVHTYTVSYNANGGSGAPGNQTKTYGVNLTLSTAVPSRTNYTFKGWGTSASATSATYAAGGTYTNNSGITLYAVWELNYVKPRISNSQCYRCDSNGNQSDEGTYGRVVFTWATDRTVSSIKVEWKPDTGSSWSSQTISASGTSGTNASAVFGGGNLDVDTFYNVKLTVTDSGGNSSVNYTISGSFLLTDELVGGRGYAFGKAATMNNYLDVALNTLFRKVAKLEHGNTNEPAWFEAARTDTGARVRMGVGSGGTAHGVYSHNAGNWLLQSDGHYTHIGAMHGFGVSSQIADVRTITGQSEAYAATEMITPGYFGSYRSTWYFALHSGYWYAVLHITGWTTNYQSTEIWFPAGQEPRGTFGQIWVRYGTDATGWSALTQIH